MSSKHLQNQTWQWSGWTSGIPRVVLRQRTLSIIASTLEDSLLPSKVPIWTQVSHSVRTVGSGDIQHLAITLISPGAPSAIELTLLNTTERKYGVAWKTRKQIVRPPKKASHVHTSSNAWTAKVTIKQTAIVVHIGATVSIVSGMVENNRNSFKSRVQ